MQDIELVLRRRHRSDSSKWEIIWKIDQRFIKNNTDPENIRQVAQDGPASC